MPNVAGRLTAPPEGGAKEVQMEDTITDIQLYIERVQDYIIVSEMEGVFDPDDPYALCYTALEDLREKLFDEDGGVRDVSV